MVKLGVGQLWVLDSFYGFEFEGKVVEIIKIDDGVYCEYQDKEIMFDIFLDKSAVRFAMINKRYV